MKRESAPSIARLRRVTHRAPTPASCRVRGWIECAGSLCEGKPDRDDIMASALIEDPRTTLYRWRLAGLLRRPSCRWLSFAIGTAAIHRTFFESVAVALEGLPAGEVRDQFGMSHRQVQYGVRLRIGATDLDGVRYDADRDHLLTVPAEGAFDTLENQA